MEVFTLFVPGGGGAVLHPIKENSACQVTLVFFKFIFHLVSCPKIMWWGWVDEGPIIWSHQLELC